MYIRYLPWLRYLATAQGVGLLCLAKWMRKRHGLSLWGGYT